MSRVEERVQAVVEARDQSLDDLYVAACKLKQAIRAERIFQNEKLAERCSINKRFVNLESKDPTIPPIRFLLPEDEEKYQGRGYKCYVCRQRFHKVHHFYHRMCPECAKENYEKREQTADLTGKVAIVTGGRIKIGFQTCLKLLRAGATVIATTRFPTDARERYQAEADYKEWAERLKIRQLNLLDRNAIGEFLELVHEEHPHVDILINNAAQTIDRPPEYYNKLLSDAPVESFDFPDLVDENGLQVDQRLTNTWITHLDSTDESELMAVTLVNYIAPFILLKGLRKLMGGKSPSCVINVSSMEGKFITSARFKPDRHVHNNAAKAALNMITRSIAFSWQKDNIFVNSVETGWITNEFPNGSFGKKKDSVFLPPLDEIDGAARILDPIFTHNQGAEIWGQFLKDYYRASW